MPRQQKVSNVLSSECTSPNKSDSNSLAKTQENEQVSICCPGKTKSKDNLVTVANSKIPPCEAELDPDTVCGIGGFQPRWMQRWATPRAYLLLYSTLGVITGIYYTYRIGVITTLEKRFAFKSKISGAIMMVDEITPVFLGAQIGYLGGKFHRPRMFGLGMLMTILCCFVSALPYFIYGPGTRLSNLRVNNESELEMCLNERVEHCESDDRPPTQAAILLLMLAGLLKGFGNLAFHSIGLSYLDDNAKKKNTALYFAATFSVRLVGPVIGYLLASFFLKYPENPLSEPPFAPEDPRWVGAWWMGFLVQGVLLSVFTIPLIMFPRRLPGQKKQVQVTKTSLKDLCQATKRLFVNPVYMAISANSCLQIFGGAGHLLMLPKYMEQQFRLSASDANLYSGPPGIVPVIVATAIGGSLVWKFRPGAKQQIRIMILLEVVSIVGYLLLTIPKCEKLSMQSFGMDANGLILEGMCNSNCSCSTKTFNPTCGSDLKSLFFSPCFAGCIDQANKSFTDCSCAMDAFGRNNAHVTVGFCVSEDCWSQALAYIITFPIFQLINNLLRVQYTVIMLRSVRTEDKSIALGCYEALICMFGFVPFLVIFGSLVDTACLVWGQSCGHSGNCWFYDTDHLNWLMHGLSASFTVLSVLSMLVPYHLSDRLGDLYVEDKKVAADSEVRSEDLLPKTPVSNIQVAVPLESVEDY